MRLTSTLAAAALAALLASPAMARDGRMQGGAMPQPQPAPYWGGMPGANWYGGWQQPYVVNGPAPQAAPEGPPPQNRDDWLRECRRRLGDNGVGGAVIGGVVGGVAGNVIAGKGNRVLGTVAGAAVGAVAGAAIDKAEDKARTRDRCETMLDAPQYPAGYGYAPAGYMMVPVMMVPVMAPAAPAAKGECKETVTTTEYVTYETRRSRVIPRRATKTVRIVPDKRVKMVPDKRVPQ
jgi:hypothetical protein